MPFELGSVADGPSAYALTKDMTVVRFDRHCAAAASNPPLTTENTADGEGNHDGMTTARKFATVPNDGRWNNGLPAWIRIAVLIFFTRKLERHTKDF